jgi:hypothetical protein
MILKYEIIEDKELFQGISKKAVKKEICFVRKLK